MPRTSIFPLSDRRARRSAVEQRPTDASVSRRTATDGSNPSVCFLQPVGLLTDGRITARRSIDRRTERKSSSMDLHHLQRLLDLPPSCLQNLAGPKVPSKTIKLWQHLCPIKITSQEQGLTNLCPSHHRNKIKICTDLRACSSRSRSWIRNLALIPLKENLGFT